jgi:hypothetical protein
MTADIYAFSLVIEDGETPMDGSQRCLWADALALGSLAECPSLAGCLGKSKCVITTAINCFSRSENDGACARLDRPNFKPWQ